MRYREIIREGKSHPVICVDVQPEYSGINDGSEDPTFPEIIHFVNKQTGPVLMFVNAEDTGVSGDSIDGIRQYWDDTVCGFESEEDRYEEDEYGDYVEKECEEQINWNRFDIVDKGYGYFREAMDSDVPESLIIKVIRRMYQEKVSDSRELFDGSEDPNDFIEWFKSLGYGDYDAEHSASIILNGISVEWTSVVQLRKFNGAYIVGGGRNECLREVELLMNAFNIKYKRIDSLVYG